MRISDWSSDVCPSDLATDRQMQRAPVARDGAPDHIEKIRERAFDVALFEQIGDHHHETVILELLADDRRLGQLCETRGARRENLVGQLAAIDRKSTRLNSSHYCASRMPSSA